MGKHTPLPEENMWISRLLIELQSSPKNQKNPHDQLIWGGNTFQNSIYHRFSLKPGFVFFFKKILPPFGYLGFKLSYGAHQKTKIILRTYLYGAGTLSKALSIIVFL